MPDNILNLVIVTGMQSKENLIAARVWRGLSKQIENLSLEVYTPPNPVDPDIIKATLEKAQNDTKLITDLLRSKLGLGLLFFFPFLVAYYFFFHHNNIFNNSQSKATPTPTVVATLAPTTANPTVNPTATPEVQVTNTIAPSPTQTASISPSPSVSPKPTPTQAAIPSTKNNSALGTNYLYIVKEGDNLTSIYENCKITDKDIVSIDDPSNKQNKKEQILQNPNTLQHKDVIKFKAAQSYFGMFPSL